MARYIYINVLLLLLLIGVQSCSDDDSLKPFPSVTVEGLVKSLVGNVPVSAVKVVIRSETDFSDSTTTDAVGYYRFQSVPDGTYKIYFSKGSFADTVGIAVPITGYAPIARVKTSKPLAFYWGDYDDLQTIIRNMGYAPDSLVLSDFYNPQKLLQYSIICINSGISARNELSSGPVSDNLRNYLNSGGRIYASDWAFSCVMGIHPELEGTFTGSIMDSVKAGIVYTPLSTRLNKDSAIISYNSASWLSLDTSINQSVNIPYLKLSYGTVSDNPIAFFRFENNSGKLIYTTFHRDPLATVDMINILQYFFFEL